MKLLFITLICLCAFGCDEPNVKPAANNVNEYLLQDELRAFISDTFNEFKHFKNQQDLDRYLQENGSKYRHLNRYQDEVHFIKMRFDDYLKMTSKYIWVAKQLNPLL